MIELTVKEETRQIDMDIGQVQEVSIRNYEKLIKKPMINTTELIGDRSSEELGLLGEDRAISLDEIMAICQ